MSAGASAPGGQDFDLNLAPIIDCFTVLITFMLASASFLSIGILDAGVAAAGATTNSTEAPPPVNVALELAEGRRYVIKITGKVTETFTIDAAQGEWDPARLTEKLAAIHARWPEVKALTLTAGNDVEYKNVVQAMDTARKQIPAVLLGGF